MAAVTSSENVLFANILSPVKSWALMKAGLVIFIVIITVRESS